jgi:hypothetical protein
MQVEINGISADLGSSIISMDRRSFDIENPGTRFIDITNQFQLPDTEVNRKIFLGGRAIGSTSDIFERLFPAKIIDQFFLFNGVGFVTEINKQGFKFQIVDKSKEIFQQLDVPLRSVNWDDKDILLNGTNLDSLDGADITTCWIWPSICCHEQKVTANTALTTGNNRVKFSRPSFYLQGLLSRVITGGGYSFTPVTPDLAMSANHKEFFFTSYQKTLSASFSAGNITGLSTGTFEKNVTTASTTIDIGTYKTKFRLRGSVSASTVMTLTVRSTNNVTAEVQNQYFYFDPAISEIDFSTNDFFNAQGLTISFILTGAGTVTFSGCLLYSLISEASSVDFTTNPWLGYKIKAYDNLPEYTYLDLFRVLCTLTNSIQNIDTMAMTFGFKRMGAISNMNSVDWSDKFIVGSEKITSKFKNLARVNWLKYNNDKFVGSLYGSHSFAIDNDTLTDEVDYLTINFGASYDVTIGSTTIGNMEVYTDTGRIADRELNPRIFSVTGSLATFAPISWPVLAASVYAGLITTLNRVREITCQMNLNKLDVITWQQDRLSFIDYFKSQFLVTEINNFIPGKSTEVTILKWL